MTKAISATKKQKLRYAEIIIASYTSVGMPPSPGAEGGSGGGASGADIDFSWGEMLMTEVFVFDGFDGYVLHAFPHA